MLDKDKRKAIYGIITVFFIIFLAYILDTGMLYKSIIFFLVLSMLIAGYRIWRGWEQYKLVVELGSDQLKMMEQIRKQHKKGDKK